VLAFVLGPLMETSLRQSLILSQGGFDIFVTRPISAVLLAVAFLMLVTPLVRRLARRQAAGRIAPKTGS
jgi:putative tricarboxylic transport membrane protein